MQEAWAIREVNDEVIKISKQLGVKNIIHYGGPGMTKHYEPPLDNYNSYKNLVEKLKSGEQMTIDNLDLDKQLLDKINKFAPIKYILNKKINDDHEIMELLEDISRDLMNYDLEFRIQELESKFSKDLSEATFNELKELKKKQNIN